VDIQYIFHFHNILNNHNMRRPAVGNVGRPGWHPGTKGSGFDPRGERSFLLSFAILFLPLVFLRDLTGL
jgi:hypothetical protein